MAALRERADHIQSLVGGLTHDTTNSTWQNALLSLMESYHVTINTLDRTVSIDDYLDQAVGFQSAYSFPQCSPPRSIVYCTTSLIQHYKCGWLQESAGVYGIEPNIQCVRTESERQCMLNIRDGLADVMRVGQDVRLRAQTEFGLRPLMYEYAPEAAGRYVTVAVVLGDSELHRMEDLRGKRACFGAKKGAALVSVWETMRNLSLIATNVERAACGRSGVEAVSDYFNVRVSNADGDVTDDDDDGDDVGALRCLAEGNGDVAFVDLAVFQNMTAGRLQAPWVSSLRAVRLLCPFGLRPQHETDPCYLHWTPRGHLMVSAKLEQLRRNEMFNSLRDMDKLFGKHYQTHTIPFSMYGTFDRQNNVMFRDATDGLRSLPELRKVDRWPRMAEEAFVALVNVTRRDDDDEKGRRVCSGSENGEGSKMLVLSIMLGICIGRYFS